jgi:hypothetical protein
MQAWQQQDALAGLETVEVIGAPNTRRSLYQPLLQPFLDDLPRLTPQEKSLRFVQMLHGINALGGWMLDTYPAHALNSDLSTTQTPFVPSSPASTTRPALAWSTSGS